MKRTKALAAASLVGAAVTLIAFAGPAAANPNAINPIPGLNGTNGIPNLTGRTQAVAQQTGMLSPNRTQDANVLGTDLGIMWDNGQGQVLTAFGDSAGLGLPNLLSGSLWAWRSSTLFRSSDGILADGMNFDSSPRDIFGQSKELVPSPKIPFVEISRIPTAGVAVGNTQVLSMMSVKNWGPAGTWDTNYSGLVYSQDNGENWTVAPETQRPNVGGNANFQMSAFVKADGFVYQYGTPAGRGGLVHIARVPEPQIMDLGAYEYFDGAKWIKGNPDVAKPIMPGGVGELSVAYNEYLGQYLMLTTDQYNSVVMRRSPSVTGPWGPPEVLVDTRELPTAYGAYIHPWSSGRDLYFLTTVHNNYNVLLMRTTLTP
ncbi:hypothetical protein JOJ86_002387 [Rhodococcus percolatus]|uniref:DUF4185 domain-containing protein n=1 Tax=Rhodococcus opacus TaxID=37919 RepID=UPI0015FD0590|nr:DUF4185 domain-containing protein [Rhodococcus opacus]MBA8959096.1 hypothetical protein [Rhodococcus opacus]MBP2204661.1 hypothetical protein [Rhodococcus opacus]MDV6241455.1 DUF4185 domain-containing protein [Rhodococcus opacus]